MPKTKRKLESPEQSRVKSQRLDKKKIAAQYIGPANKKIEADAYIKEFCDKFQRPEDGIEWLLSNANMSVSEFFATKWEKSPLAMHSTENTAGRLEAVFSAAFLKKLLDTHKKQQFTKGFTYRIDFQAAKFVDGEYIEIDKKATNCLADGKSPVDFDQLEGFLKDGYTIQMPEPQRFQPALHALMEPLESYFGALVTANAYLAPPGGQMRPPRFDNEDYFVLQTEGAQTWKLYQATVELATQFSDTLSVNEIGKPKKTETLNPGDVLYMPRGTIFQTAAGPSATSAYVILSTYCEHHVGRFVRQAVGRLLHHVDQRSRVLHRPLPLGLMPRLCRPSLNEAYADTLVSLAEAIRKTSTSSQWENQLAMDSFVDPFMTCRLPPFRRQLYRDDVTITNRSRIQLHNKRHVAYYLRETEVDYADEEAGETPLLYKRSPKWRKASASEVTSSRDEDENQRLAEKNRSVARADRDLSPKFTPDETGLRLAVFCSVYNDARLHRDYITAGVNDNMATFHSGYITVLDQLMAANEPLLVADLAKSLDRNLNLTKFLKTLSNMGALDVIKASSVPLD
ncbi:MYC-induced nuclear antigen-like [Tropilaelaps mercedesae]|uniref:Bifunctional lysine-specific demethylase and histidyl-hydroxylase n=1 Tax=Tropilaelaps mercedesae TaxID=418985 RepID=A0A1V9Y276_9ACAR|nr:MYC-induced nuclear antigen-like [Tropilaelaps mercedesae]